MPADITYRFGTYSLIPQRRLLLSGDEPVQVGSRAFAILVALVERAGVVVASQELIRIAWPGVVVEEANLRVQIGALRKLLEGEGGRRRAIETVPLQGYCFVEPVEQIASETGKQPVTAEFANNLPMELTTVVGRHETVEMLVQAISQRRLVTITGHGGIGKTTVAMGVARKCMSRYPDGVRFVDFSPISDPNLVPAVLASALGIAVVSGDALMGLLAHLSGKQLVLVLDTCEHLIESVTSLTETLLANLPQIRILATSRETLRAAGEWVHRLPPLAVPPDDPSLGSADIIGYPSVGLFVQRVAASVDGFELRDSEAAFVSTICRQLDGIPLAIEFAAAHVEEIGIREVTASLGDRLSILTKGRRTALPRHQTLAATLEWSYDLLPESERAVLRHLSVFRGSFSSEAARTVAAFDMDKRQGLTALSNLHSKSLVTADVGAHAVLYRLLDTTRCFAFEKEMSAGDWEATQRRHAQFLLGAVQCAEREWEILEADVWRARYGYLIEDTRGALAWAFSPAGDSELALSITAASSPLWFALSLLEEYRRHVEHSLSLVQAAVSAEPAAVIRLWDALGHALWHARGDMPAMRKAFSRVLDIAQSEHRLDDQLRGLWGLLVCSNTNGDYADALETLERFRELAARADSLKADMTYRRMAALSLHYAGDHGRAAEQAEYVLNHPSSRSHQARQTGLQFDQRITSRSMLARTLWVRGFADQARLQAHEGLLLSQSTGHALSECFVLANAVIPIAFWSGDLATAATLTGLLLLRSSEHGFGIWKAFGAGYETILKRRADPSGPVATSAQVGMHLRETLATCDESFVDEELLDRATRGVAGWSAPELLRIRATQKRSKLDSHESVESALTGALQLARQQGALAWELRIAASLFDVLLLESRHAEARSILGEVLSKFSEGFTTADLMAASAKLEIRSKASAPECRVR